MEVMTKLRKFFTFKPIGKYVTQRLKQKLLTENGKKNSMLGHSELTVEFWKNKVMIFEKFRTFYQNIEYIESHFQRNFPKNWILALGSCLLSFKLLLSCNIIYLNYIIWLDISSRAHEEGMPSYAMHQWCVRKIQICSKYAAFIFQLFPQFNSLCNSYYFMAVFGILFFWHY